MSVSRSQGAMGFVMFLDRMNANPGTGQLASREAEFKLPVNTRTETEAPNLRRARDWKPEPPVWCIQCRCVPHSSNTGLPQQEIAHWTASLRLTRADEPRRFMVRRVTPKPWL